MHIQGKGIIIKNSRFGEKSFILECFTKEHGLIRGLVKSVKSISELGSANLIHFVYRARLESHLGFFQVESIRNYIGFIGFNRLKIQLTSSVLSILNVLLHEGAPNPNMYDIVHDFLEGLCHEDAAVILLKQYALLELELMQHAGYGLDLAQCAVSKSTQDLVYISPKSGCAISEEHGRPYHSRLFKMPKFYMNKDEITDLEEALIALEMNEFFLRRRIFEPCNMNLPSTRANLGKNLNVNKAA